MTPRDAPPPPPSPDAPHPLARRLAARAVQPGVVRHDMLAATLGRVQRMARPNPLLDTVQRRHAVGHRAAGSVPIVHAFPAPPADASGPGAASPSGSEVAPAPQGSVQREMRDASAPASRTAGGVADAAPVVAPRRASAASAGGAAPPVVHARADVVRRAPEHGSGSPPPQDAGERPVVSARRGVVAGSGERPTSGDVVQRQVASPGTDSRAAASPRPSSETSPRSSSDASADGDGAASSGVHATSSDASPAPVVTPGAGTNAPPSQLVQRTIVAGDLPPLRAIRRRGLVDGTGDVGEAARSAPQTGDVVQPTPGPAAAQPTAPVHPAPASAQPPAQVHAAPASVQRALAGDASHPVSPPLTAGDGSAPPAAPLADAGASIQRTAESSSSAPIQRTAAEPGSVASPSHAVRPNASAGDATGAPHLPLQRMPEMRRSGPAPINAPPLSPRGEAPAAAVRTGGSAANPPAAAAVRASSPADIAAIAASASHASLGTASTGSPASPVVTPSPARAEGGIVHRAMAADVGGTETAASSTSPDVRRGDADAPHLRADSPAVPVVAVNAAAAGGTPVLHLAPSAGGDAAEGVVRRRERAVVGPRAAGGAGAMRTAGSLALAPSRDAAGVAPPRMQAFGRTPGAAAPAIVHIAPAAAPAGPDGTVMRSAAAGAAPRGRVQRQGMGDAPSSGALPELPDARAPEEPKGPDVDGIAEQVYQLIVSRLQAQRAARGL